MFTFGHHKIQCKTIIRNGNYHTACNPSWVKTGYNTEWVMNNVHYRYDGVVNMIYSLGDGENNMMHVYLIYPENIGITVIRGLYHCFLFSVSMVFAIVVCMVVSSMPWIMFRCCCCVL